MKRLIVLCTGFATLLVASGAFADLTTIGDPIEGGSWSQQFNESGVGSFDLVAVRMTSAGDTFEHWTFSNFNQPNWSTANEYENASQYPTLASAWGTSVTDMNFNIKFAGVNANQLAFDFVAFKSGTETILESAHAEWSGSSWNITAGTWNPTRNEVVPLPAAVLLGMLGLGAAGLKLRKFV